VVTSIGHATSLLRRAAISTGWVDATISVIHASSRAVSRINTFLLSSGQHCAPPTSPVTCSSIVNDGVCWHPPWCDGACGGPRCTAPLPAACEQRPTASFVPDLPDHDLARVDSHSHRKPEAVLEPQFVGVAPQFLLEVQRRVASSLRVIFMRDRRAEKRHD